MASSLEGLSQKTLDILQKAATSGILVSTGVQGVDLSGFTSLVPVNVPARNNTSAFPRVVAGTGSQVALWRTWLNQNSSQFSAAVGLDNAGSMTQFLEQDVYAPYKPLAKAGRVTLDAIAVARNYVDALAQGELQVLNQLFIAQDMNIINAQNWAVPVPATPVATAVATGGLLPNATTYFVKVAARSGANYFEGGSTPASSNSTIVTTASATASVVATTAAVKGAVAYDWYVSTTVGGTYNYYATTTVAKVTITAANAGTAVQPLSSLPLLSSLLPGAGIAPFAQPPTAGNGVSPTVDTSYNANYYNGIIASTLGDYGATNAVTPGSGVASGATFIDWGAAAPTNNGSGIDVLDAVNDALWAQVQLSPTAYMVNSVQADEISKLILGTNSATTFLPPTDADARTNLSGGGYIARYVNRAAGGVPVSIEVHPRVAPGTIIARTDRVPFPGSNIGSVYEVRCQYDTMRFDYAANWAQGGTGPRYDFEIRSMETLVNRAPVAQAIVTNIL